MFKKPRELYKVEDFVADESFSRFYFHSNIDDTLSWKEWLLRHPEKNELVKEAGELIQTLTITIPDNEFSAELEKLSAAINVEAPRPLFSVHGNLKKQRDRKKNILYAAFAVLFLIVAGYLLLPVLRRTSTKELIETVNRTAAPLTIILSDSTLVTLLPHGSLQYPLHFTNDQRNVYLHGEAQFNVKRNIHAPFKVFAENIVATVLGTVFNFKRSGDSAIVVELIKGKLNVEVLNDKKVSTQSILLSPNEKAIYSLHDQFIYKETMATEINLYFHKNDFSEIARQVKKAFGITLINESDKKSWRFTGDFKKTSAKEIIENICLIKGLSYEVKGDTIYIK